MTEWGEGRHNLMTFFQLKITTQSCFLFHKGIKECTFSHMRRKTAFQIIAGKQHEGKGLRTTPPPVMLIFCFSLQPLWLKFCDQNRNRKATALYSNMKCSRGPCPVLTKPKQRASQESFFCLVSARTNVFLARLSPVTSLRMPL